MEDVSNYEKLKEDVQNFYNYIGKASSLALKQDIYFNLEGFNYNIFKGSSSERERPSQILRFKLLHLAVKLIKLSTSYQEFEETLKEFEVKNHKKRIRKTKPVR
jgi:hypothetical protein